jgi:CheY-like chemotaxis protein
MLMIVAAEVAEVDRTNLRVVLVDSRAERRKLIRQLVEGTGLTAADIAEAGSQAEAVALLSRQEVDVVIVEIQMPVDKGLETIAALRQLSSRVRIVVCSFHRDAATKDHARARGADAYLDKPMGFATLKATLLELFPDSSTASTPPSPEAPPWPPVPTARPGGLRAPRAIVDRAGNAPGAAPSS